MCVQKWHTKWVNLYNLFWRKFMQIILALLYFFLSNYQICCITMQHTKIDESLLSLDPIIIVYFVSFRLAHFYLAFCQRLSDFQFSDSFGKLRSFYIKFISITIFYSDSKGSRNCLKVLLFFALFQRRRLNNASILFTIRYMHLIGK